MPSVDVLIVSIVVALFDLWPWMLGWLLVGALLPVTFALLLKHVRQPYRACLMTVMAIPITWLAIEFYFRCLEYATTGIMTMHIYIERPSPAASFTLGVLATFIGTGLVVVTRKIRRPPP
jgi:hypothetical protein